MMLVVTACTYWHNMFSEGMLLHTISMPPLYTQYLSRDDDVSWFDSTLDSLWVLRYELGG